GASAGGATGGTVSGGAANGGAAGGGGAASGGMNTGGTGGDNSAGTGGMGGAAGAGGQMAMGGTGGGAAAMSAGCGMLPGATDSSTNWIKHDITVTGVDPAFVAQYPVNPGQTYDWTHRNYFLRLPTDYDQTHSYPIVIGGSGCGGSETVGSEGGYSPFGIGSGETEAIQVSLSYVLSSAAIPDCNGAVFADDFDNSPEAPYLAAVVNEVESLYCTNPGKVFLSGYSSGAFEAVTLGCANGDILRGFGVQIGGGLRLHHPPCKPNPVAAIFVVGLQDTENPIGPLTTPLHDSLGTAPARDEILTRNGCVGQDHMPWDPDYPLCETYTGCPAAYPVVWCAINSGHIPPMGDPEVAKYRIDGIKKFYLSLP
ncbi:MAG TPA: hypothetical protein VL137_17720, partial [Polyangiaceae bacterium]|nr:hypothetical protein [Polyangiaceae bacterium]